MYFVYILHCVGAVYFSAGCCLACVFVCILCIFVYHVYFLYFALCSVFQCKLLLSMRAHRTRRSVDRQDRAIHQGPTPTRHNALMISRRFLRKPFSISIAHFHRAEYAPVFTFLSYGLDFKFWDLFYRFSSYFLLPEFWIF